MWIITPLRFDDLIGKDGLIIPSFLGLAFRLKSPLYREAVILGMV